jgi:hypothetical protein
MGREMNSWRTFGHQPRYVTNYVGLRNRMAILIENYAYAEYRDRVMGNYHYLLSILDYCAEHRDDLKQMVREADLACIRRGLAPDAESVFTVEYEIKPLPDPVTIQGWEMEIEQTEGPFPRMKPTDRKKTYVIPFHSDFVSKRTVRLPFAYLMPVSVPKIEANLLGHGITVERLTEAVTLEVESYMVSELKGANRLYQGHYMNTARGEYRTETREFPAGCLVVRTAQPLSTLAAYLLEPESDDGLLVWNFFDRYLVPQWRPEPQIYPVYKLYAPANLATNVIRGESR